MEEGEFNLSIKMRVFRNSPYKISFTLKSLKAHSDFVKNEPYSTIFYDITSEALLQAMVSNLKLQEHAGLASESQQVRYIMKRFGELLESLSTNTVIEDIGFSYSNQSDQDD